MSWIGGDATRTYPGVDWEPSRLAALNETRWESIVSKDLRHAGKAEEDLVSERKGASRKVAIAKRLRRETTADNPWIARRPRMGTPNYVSNLIHA
jgi:putative transposase